MREGVKKKRHLGKCELVDMTEQLAEEMRKKNEKMDRMCSAHEKINYPKENLKRIRK